MKTKGKTLWTKAVSLVAAATLCMGLFSGCGVKDNAKGEQEKTVISVGNWPDKEGTELEKTDGQKRSF